MIKDDNYYNLLSFEEVASRIKELSDDEKVELQDDVMMAMQLREIPIKKSLLIQILGTPSKELFQGEQKVLLFERVGYHEEHPYSYTIKFVVKDDLIYCEGVDNDS